ncbi:MAG: serine/threonine-protein kinase [Planctomycetota bacterium]
MNANGHPTPTAPRPEAPDLTRERFARARNLFDKSLQLAGADRTAWLDTECGEDVELRTLVQGLLRADEEVAHSSDPDAGFIPKQLLATPQPVRLPDEVGPFRVKRLIGRGGMAIVCLAEQADPSREVALKILHVGPFAGALRQRFRREVRVLGKLEHPGIARIYEAGSAETTIGPLAYFAMEYVKGSRLTDYARDQRLSTRQCAGLVAKVADAAQHAHSNGVIHRDLKPANILIEGATTAQGEAQPKVLDFGVARLLEGDTEDPQPTAVTETGAVIGTIAYMSPEQLSGEGQGVVDARTDVYSLGVVLYELLTGRVPHDVRGKPIAEAARIVRDEEPAPLRSPDNTTGCVLDRDIATIVARALAKDRERRYATAAALADDLRRYLKNEPIQARAPTLAYQFSKFARRHRGIVAGATATLVMLIAGLVVSQALYVREQRARARASENERLSVAVREYLINGLLMSASPERMGYDAKVLDVLAKAAQDLHEHFADDPKTEASVRSDIADVLTRIGKFGESIAQWELAIPLLEQTAGLDAPATINALVKESSAYQSNRQLPLASQVAKEALARARRSLAGDDPVMVRVLTQTGGVLTAQGLIKPARPYLDEGLSLAQAAPEQHKAQIQSLYTWLAECDSKQGNVAGALDFGRRAVAHADENFGVETMVAVTARSNLLISLLRLNEAEEAVAIATILPEMAERVYAPGHANRAHVDRNCGEAMLLAKRFDESERLLQRARGTFANVFGEADAEQEGCYDALRRLYAKWPGHEKELFDTGVQSITYKLMQTPAGVPRKSRNLLLQVQTQCQSAGIDLEPGQWLELIWTRREELAPPKHPQRAMFFANFIRTSEQLGFREHFAEALALADDAMAYAGQAKLSASVLARAKRIVTKPDADEGE